jgi:hypothetical protein
MRILSDKGIEGWFASNDLAFEEEMWIDGDVGEPIEEPLFVLMLLILGTRQSQEGAQP